MSTSITVRPRFQTAFRSGSLVLLLVLLALTLLFTVLSPYFLSWRNISNILLSVSVIGVLAAVSTLVVVGRGIDLSIGSLTALLGVVAGSLVEQYGAPWYLGGLAAVALGAACGTLNGVILAYGRVNPIITTIGTLSVFRGAAYIVTDGQSILLQDPTLLFIGSGRVLGLPLAVWLLAVVVLAAQFFARYTAAGRSAPIPVRLSSPA
jgi:ribose/xylose/arabinose/galactoside ABC-type transport system permease subunit